jgi:hypothetical protein
MNDLLTIELSVNKDCNYILEAIRRLKEGTWLLCDEDSDWADHLLPIVKEAILDHIAIENACILSSLPQNEAQSHAAEHDQIMAILWAVDASRKSRNAPHFHALLDLLIKTLIQHHNHCSCGATHLTHCIGHVATTRIISRAVGTSLEDL